MQVNNIYPNRKWLLLFSFLFSLCFTLLTFILVFKKVLGSATVTHHITTYHIPGYRVCFQYAQFHSLSTCFLYGPLQRSSHKQTFEAKFPVVIFIIAVSVFVHWWGFFIFIVAPFCWSMLSVIYLVLTVDSCLSFMCASFTKCFMKWQWQLFYPKCLV